MWKKPIYNLIDSFTLKMNRWSNLLQESQYWTCEQLLDLQLKKLKILSDKFGLGIKSWEDFYHLHLTSKEDLPTDQSSLKKSGRRVIQHETSGSTGEPRKILVPEEHWIRKEAYFSRSWKWLGWKDQPVLRLGPEKPKWPWYDYWRNVKVLPRKTIDQRHTDYIIGKKPFIIHGRGGGVRDSCESVIDAGRADVLANTKIVWAGEDATESKQRLGHLVKSFHESYGLAELAPVATPCPYDMHINLECAILEIVDGQLYVTDLDNDVMPFIRYKTGDEGKIRESDCPCGLKHPILYDVKGRRTDYYKGPEVKKPIHWWVVGPISHDYGDVVKAWKAEIYPKKGEFKLYVVFRDKENLALLEPYEVWIKNETGLDCTIIPKNSAVSWKRDLVRVFT